MSKVLFTVTDRSMRKEHNDRRFVATKATLDAMQISYTTEEIGDELKYFSVHAQHEPTVAAICREYGKMSYMYFDDVGDLRCIPVKQGDKK